MLRRALTAAALALGLVAVGSASAGAITGGAADGDEHPNVAFIIAYSSETGRRTSCSAVLVSPEVVLTAAHCVAHAVGQVAVTFDTHIADAPPPPFPRASSPGAYSSADILAAGWLPGTGQAMPAYAGVGPKGAYDVGAVVLESPAPVAPAPLATVGHLDAMPTSRLVKTLFTAVGYGAQAVTSATPPKIPTLEIFPLMRRRVDEPGQKVTGQLLVTNGNPKDAHGGGGTCQGDSGGPILDGGLVVAVDSWSKNDRCRSLSGNQRVDLPAVHAWLASLGVHVPA